MPISPHRPHQATPPAPMGLSDPGSLASQERALERRRRLDDQQRGLGDSTLGAPPRKPRPPA